MAGFWKEVVNIYTGLLFLQGHVVEGQPVHDGDPAAEAANDPAPAATDAARKASQRTLGAFERVLFLGGRPMHPDQPYDREEPFEQLVVAQDVRDAQPLARCA